MKNKYKLICFDLNKTLIVENSWSVLNTALGITKEEDQRMLNLYCSGQISYQQWQRRLEKYYLKSRKANKRYITNILTNYTYLPGVLETVKYLMNKNYNICLISGAPDIVVKKVAEELNIKYWFSNNNLIFNKDNTLKRIDVIDDEVAMKKQTIIELCNILKIKPQECVCVGDGDNDIGIFELTKHGITFPNSKIVKYAWKVVTDLSELKVIL